MEKNKMKFAEMASGLQTVLTNEQLDLIRLIKEHNILQHDDLTERGAYIAEELTSRGLIERAQDAQEKVYYQLQRR
jgi:predicted transcriptional regulator